ncbi:MAG: glycosyltransferase [Gammaproteobacteria bacterium]|nr:glycosyltransferase [Gammaproteobacteria bacterium]
MTPAPGRISVIMPCYNAEPYVAQAVECVLGQTWGDVELIVVDDGSKDRSREILLGYGERIRYLEQTNQGPYPARNQGLRFATGEFVAFLDADDWWAPDCLEKLHAALTTRPDAALAYCGWRNVGLTGPRGEPHVPPDYEAEGKLERFLRAASPWPIHAALVRRDVMQKAGGFDTHWPTCMDYDLWLRIGATHPIVLVPEVLAFYRFHQSGQITSTQWRQAENSWLVKKKFLASHPQVAGSLSAAQRRDLVDGALSRRGLDLYWKRDLVSARKVFRLVLKNGAWKMKDLRYLLPALLPERLYRALIGGIDKR